MVSMYIEMYKTPYFLRNCSFLAILAHENVVETLNFDFFQKKFFDLIYKHKNASNEGGNACLWKNYF